MSELQEKARRRNFIKFVLSGLYKPLDTNVMTSIEKGKWDKIVKLKNELLKSFDKNSKAMGFNVGTKRTRLSTGPIKHRRATYGKVAKRYSYEYIETKGETDKYERKGYSLIYRRKTNELHAYYEGTRIVYLPNLRTPRELNTVLSCIHG